MIGTLREWLEEPRVLAATIVVGSVLAAYVVEIVFSVVFLTLTRKTKNDLDDKIVAALRRPVFIGVLCVGLSVASMQLALPHPARFALYGLLETVVVLTCAVAAFRIGTAVLQAISHRATAKSVIQPRTVPVFDMAVKLGVVGLAIYFFFLSWRIDVTAWLASAGIVGIAVGFAAKDSLANLFAGIFIVADAPYKIGDFIVLDDGLRGCVTRIGFRSTRILSRDDVEITVPNSIIGNSKIVNEMGGPYTKQRVKVSVSAAYGSNVDQVREVLLSVTKGADGVVDDPQPDTRFSAFGASGLEFDLLVWVDDPAARDRVISQLNNKVYKAFAAAGIEIPYSKHDVYIKQMPASE
ncbi:MAG TPA: mechanosensitive ion channel family protein [Kofleriaceae bacterium]|nr:mechanosensitive ion channel family protein [Kofleriaceae bacterium]